MVLTLLILISMGWSLNYLSGPQLDIAFPIRTHILIFSQFYSNNKYNINTNDPIIEKYVACLIPHV